MVRAVITVLSILIAVTNSARAQSCRPVDLRPRLDEVVTQDLNTCYMYPVADALTIASGRRVSPQSVLFRYLSGRGRGEAVALNMLGLIAGKLQGGIGSTALRAAQARPVCTEDEVGSSPLRETDWDLALASHDELRATFTPREPTVLIARVTGAVGRLFTKIEPARLRSELKPGRTFDGYVNAVLDLQCHELAGRFAGFTVRGHEFRPDADRAQREIDRSLDAEQLPVVHLDDGLFFDGVNAIYAVPRLPGLHVVSVVARRPSPNGCRYLIRNSWGPDCSDYPADVTARCERGSFWFTAKEMRPYVKSASWLRPRTSTDLARAK